MWRYLHSREPRVICLDPFDDFGGIVSPTPMHAAYDLQRYDVCWRRVLIPESGRRAFFQEFLQVLIRHVRNALVMVDEATMWMSKEPTEELEELNFQGRRYGLRTGWGCQRINRMPGIILGELTDMVVFRTRRPRDLYVLEEWSEDPTISEVAPHLDVGECLYLEDM